MLRQGTSTGFQPADTLGSRTYRGLIGSQFLAAFNDQAIHVVAIFYAGDMLIEYAHVPHVRENSIIALVTACFVLPFFLFSTLAGMLADRYSKRNILVFWKVAEVAITGLVLFGFVLPHTAALGWADPRTLAVGSALIVVSGVFLMGTHSAFFIPAKYGVMPEILEHSVLSKGNGFLEGTSFVAQIFGTVAGAALYGQLKAVQPDGTPAFGREWVLGLILFALAILGTACSFLIERVPPAAPDRPLTWKLWQPLGHNLGVLLRSRPLALSVVGIAFFACLTLYARQTLLYDGEAAKDYNEARRAEQIRKQEEARRAPRARPPANEGAEGENNGEAAEPPVVQEQNAVQGLNAGVTGARAEELRVALLMALVGLGVGIGNLLAGYLSGNKVELGLVPIGTFLLILFTTLLAFFFQRAWGRVTFLILIGVAAGLYIVPLYTLLQHRAPRDSKGNLVATSNFINVVGGLLAIGVFWLVTAGLEKYMGIGPVPTKDQSETKMIWFTKILFLSAALMTAGMLFLLCQQLPDFFTRTLLWLRSLTRYHLHVVGLNNLPPDGPVILATNCETPEGCMQVLTATDRFTRFILLEHSPEARLPWLLRYLAERTHLAVLKPGPVSDAVLGRTLDDAVRVLQRGEMVGLPANGNGVGFDVDRFLGRLRARIPAAQILPVYCGPDVGAGEHPGGRARVCVAIGKPAPADTPADVIRRDIHELAACSRGGHGEVSAATPAAAAASPTAPAAGPPAPPSPA